MSCKRASLFSIAVLASASVVATGCTKEEPKPVAAVKSEHDHPTTGPHGGDLIELGDETYHVELVHDDRAGEVTFYVLDGKAKGAAPIAATEVVVNLKLAGAGKQFKVAAKPDTADPAGKSSRFFSAEKELAAALDAEKAEPVLVLEIDGKQFRGALSHDHKH